MIKSINIKAIRIDCGTQSREKLDQAVVEDYAEQMKEGQEFPPISVVHDGSEYYLSDGFHRILAAQKAGKASINCDVITGTLRDAILYSLSANSKHGKQRTIEDKRKVVMTMLEDFEWGDIDAWSDREIARQCHVSQPFVSKLRASIRTPQTPKTDNVITSKTEKKAEPKVEEPQIETPDPRDEVIDELVERNAELEKRLAVEIMEATPEEKSKAKDLIEELQDQVKQLTIENQALSVSRDTFQAENAQLKKQVKMLQKKLKDAGIE